MRAINETSGSSVLMAACLLSLSACSAKQDKAGTAPQIATDGTPVDDMMAGMPSDSGPVSGVSTDGLIAQKVMIQWEAQGNAVMAAICEEQINARKELGEGQKHRHGETQAWYRWQMVPIPLCCLLHSPKVPCSMS